jgi:polar amino acid transport system substrate-binding protein
MKSRIAILTIILCALAAIAVAQSPARSVVDGVYSEEQLKRGQNLFVENCSDCHGEDYNGGEEAPALAGAAFMANWAGLTVADLSEKLRTSMPPDNPGKISRQQNVDIISAILAVNNFPAGKAELDSRSEVLKQIKIEHKK